MAAIVRHDEWGRYTERRVLRHSVPVSRSTSDVSRWHSSSASERDRLLGGSYGTPGSFLDGGEPSDRPDARPFMRQTARVSFST